MLKRFSSAALIAATLLTNVHISLAANDAVPFADSNQEIARAEAMLNAIVAETRQQELKNVGMDSQQIADKMKLKQAEVLKIVAAKKEELQKMKGYRDLQTGGTFEDAVKMLRDRGYPVDEAALGLYRDIDTYKKTKNVADPVAIVAYFNAQAGLKEKSVLPGISFVQSAYAISYDDWKKLTTSEKLLIASDPKAAIITDSLAKLAYKWTQEKFGMNGLGDKSDGYRHGTWNALMTRDISRAWAEAYATAHEDKSQAELQQKESDGYYKYQHRNMDLANNKVGRDQIAWYEYWFNCSDATVKSRISNKLTNKSGDITWLHN